MAKKKRRRLKKKIKKALELTAVGLMFPASFWYLQHWSKPAWFK